MLIFNLPSYRLSLIVFIYVHGFKHRRVTLEERSNSAITWQTIIQFSGLNPGPPYKQFIHAYFTNWNFEKLLGYRHRPTRKQGTSNSLVVVGWELLKVTGSFTCAHLIMKALVSKLPECRKTTNCLDARTRGTAELWPHTHSLCLFENTN